MTPAISSKRVRIAWALAICVDLAQALAAATELSGPLHLAINAGVDVVVMLLMWRLLGFSMLFIPSFVVELLPMVDIAPTWSLAVFAITRMQSQLPAAKEAPAPLDSPEKPEPT